MSEREKRLIDANELKDSFGFLRKMWSATEICGIIDAMPTADVTVQKWIPVSERLPSFEDAIQPTVYDDPAVLAVFKFDDRPRIWCIDVIRRNPEKFTHWMPLPSPPKECE